MTGRCGRPRKSQPGVPSVHVTVRHSVRGLLLALAMGRPLGAQGTVVDAGVSVVRFPDDSSTIAGPSIRLAATGVRGRFFGAASAGAVATFGATSGFASLLGGMASRAIGGWSTDVTGELSTVAGSSRAGGVGTALLSARALWNGLASGWWLRANGSSSARAGAVLPGGGVDAGAFWGWPNGRLSVSVTQEWTRAQLFTGRFRSGFAGTTPVRYTEAELALHLEGDRTSFDISSAARRDPDAARTIEPAISATAAFWTGETRAVVLSVAHQLPDWVHGADAADAVSVGLRLRQPTPLDARAMRLIPVVHVSDSDSGRVLRVRASGAATVEVMGDFTEWEAIALTRSGAVFERAIPLGSGSHRLVLRINGGSWRPAANTPAVDDDFGGRAGLLVVP